MGRFASSKTSPMLFTTIKTVAALLLAAALSTAIAKDDNKGGTGNKGGKNSGGANTSATVNGPAPAGDPSRVGEAAAQHFSFDAGGVVAATRDAADGSITFVWAITPPSGYRGATGSYIVRRIYTVNGVLSAFPSECRRVLADADCRGMGL